MISWNSIDAIGNLRFVWPVTGFSVISFYFEERFSVVLNSLQNFELLIFI